MRYPAYPASTYAKQLLSLSPMLHALRAPLPTIEKVIEENFSILLVTLLCTRMRDSVSVICCQVIVRHICTIESYYLVTD